MTLIVDAVLGLGACLTAAAVVWRRKGRGLPERWNKIADRAEVVVLFALLAVVVVQIIGNAVTPVAWDYPVFYTVGHNAASGQSFYDPEALLAGFAEIQAQWNVPDAWLAEVGFWYAPPTALYLAPFGYLSYPVALVLNDLLQLALFLGAILLLHRRFPLKAGAMGFVEMALLGLLFRPVITAFDFSQIVFGALLALALATVRVEEKGWLAGVALGVGAVFKHLLLIPAVLALSIRSWRVPVAAAMSIAGLGVVAGLVFGFDVYAEFVAFGPSDRSAQLALDPVIQSLNGELRRVLGDVPAGPGALDAIVYWPYLVIGGGLTLITCVIGWRASVRTELLAPSFALIALLALVVYPNTLYNTLPLMLPAFAVLLHRAPDLGLSAKWLVVFTAVVFGLVGVHSRLGFTALMLTWALLAFGIGRTVWAAGESRSLRSAV